MPRIVPLLLLLLAVGACSPLVYVPPPHQAPLLEAAGDARAGLLFGTGLQGGEGVDLVAQAAHAPVDHLFVHGTLQQSLRTDQRQTYAEAGLGTWLAIDPGLTVEALAGYGRSRFRAEHGPTELVRPTRVEVHGRLHRAYVQVNVAGSSTVPWPPLAPPATSRLGVASRLAYVRGHGFTWNLSELPSPLRGFFFEPALFARVGDGPFRLDLQLGISYPLNRPSVDYDWQLFYGSLGVSVDLGALIGG